MVKSSSLIFVLIFAFLFRLEVFSLRLVGVIILIVAGVLLMVATETHFVLGGFMLVLSGSALGGLRWSLTQVLLKDKRLGVDNPVATIFWLAPIMGAILLVVSAMLDRWSELIGSPFFESLSATLETCFFLTAPGFLAFCMILSEVTCVFKRNPTIMYYSRFTCAASSNEPAWCPCPSQVLRRRSPRFRYRPGSSATSSPRSILPASPSPHVVSPEANFLSIRTMNGEAQASPSSPTTSIANR